MATFSMQTTEDLEARVAQMLEYKLSGLTAKEPSAIIRPEDEVAMRASVNEWYERHCKAMLNEDVGPIWYPFKKVKLLGLEVSDHAYPKNKFEAFTSGLQNIQGQNGGLPVNYRACSTHGTILHACKGSSFNGNEERWFGSLMRDLHDQLKELEVWKERLFAYYSYRVSATSGEADCSHILKQLCRHLLNCYEFDGLLNLGFVNANFLAELEYASKARDEDALMRMLSRAVRDMIIGIAKTLKQQNEGKQEPSKAFTVLIVGHDHFKGLKSYKQILILFRNLVEEINLGQLTQYLEFRYILLQRGIGPVVEDPHPPELQWFVEDPTPSGEELRAKLRQQPTPTAAAPGLPEYAQQSAPYDTGSPAASTLFQQQNLPTQPPMFTAAPQSHHYGQQPQVQHHTYGQRQNHNWIGGPHYGQQQSQSSMSLPASGPQQPYSSIGGPGYMANLGPIQQVQASIYQPFMDPPAPQPSTQGTTTEQLQLPKNARRYQPPPVSDPVWATNWKPVKQDSWSRPPQPLPANNVERNYRSDLQKGSRPETSQHALPIRPAEKSSSAYQKSKPPSRKGSKDRSSRDSSKERSQRKSTFTGAEADFTPSQDTTGSRGQLKGSKGKGKAGEK